MFIETNVIPHVFLIFYYFETVPSDIRYVVIY